MRTILAIDEPLEYAKLYLDGTIRLWVDAEDSYNEKKIIPNEIMQHILK